MLHLVEKIKDTCFKEVWDTKLLDYFYFRDTVNTQLTSLLICDKPIYLSNPMNSECLITTESRIFNKEMSKDRNKGSETGLTLGNA